jgi:hypothetical protein
MSKDVFLLCFLSFGTAGRLGGSPFPRLGREPTWASSQVTFAPPAGPSDGCGWRMRVGLRGWVAVTYMFLAGIWVLRVAHGSLPR